MNITEYIESKFNVKIENLNAKEKETYFQMLSETQKAQMTPEKLRDHVIGMRYAVEKELIDEPEFIRIFIFKVFNRKQILLKARLQNLMLLEAFLVSPEMAKEQLEGMVSGVFERRDN